MLREKWHLSVSSPSLSRITPNRTSRVFFITAFPAASEGEHRRIASPTSAGHLFFINSPDQFLMESEDEAVKKARTLEARARSISHNVRCTECGSQSIEDSQADVAILLRKLIRDEVRAGKTDKDIYKKLEEDFGETVLYAPRFDMQTAAIWLSPFIVAGAAAGVWAYQKYKQKTNVHIMALNLLRGVPLTLKERETMLDLLTPPPPQRRKWGQ